VYRELSPGMIGVNVPFDVAAQLAAKYGFQSLSLSDGIIREEGVERVRDVLARHGLRAGTSGMPVNFRDDEETFERDIQTLPDVARMLSDAGCTRVLTWLRPYHETLPYQEHFEQLRRRTARICAVLQEYGIRYGLEFVGPETMRRGKPHPFIHDLDGILSLIEAVDAPNLGILLDAFHWYTSAGTRQDLEGLSDDLIVGVHVNDARRDRSREEQIDNERALPGETGVVDIATFLQTLQAIGYKGPVMAEPFSQRLRELPPEEAVAETARSLDRIWQLAGL